MDSLPLDPGSYRGTYKLVGGRSSLDLVNTVSWPGTERTHDWFDSVANLRRWMEAVGVPARSLKPRDLSLAIEIRDVLAAVLRPLAHDELPSRNAVGRLNVRVEEACTRRTIDPATLAWTWKPPMALADVFAPIVLDAADLVTASGHERLRYCPACDWLFEDQTRNGQRRWCDMADCGSRDKARRYYHRSQE